MGQRSGRARALVAAAVAVLFVLPLVFMVSGSLRAAGLPPPRSADLLPGPLAFGNYERAFELVELGRAVLNSLAVAALAVPLSVLVASWAGYALAQLPRRLTNTVVAVSLIALMIPTTALLIPRFALYRELGLIDTFGPLVAPALLGMSPLYVLVYWLNFARVPRDLLDGARLDGLTPFGIWRHVAMPLVRPATAAVALLAFITSWGNFLDPLVYLFDPDLYTLPLRLRSLEQLDRGDYPIFLAAAVVATVPAVAAFLVAQRWFLHEAWRPGRVEP
ncbi:MAG: carbohydrate ABC transporter permease [Gaiellaceae bacterium]